MRVCHNVFLEQRPRAEQRGKNVAISQDSSAASRAPITWKNVWKHSVGPKNNKESLWLFLKGFCMGTADVIPGVSGGTVAFVTGIYHQLINAINSVGGDFFKCLFRFEIKKALAQVHLKFLIPLVFGIVLAILSTARLMHYLVVHHKILTWSLFFGLITASIVVVGREIENRFRPGLLFLTGLGIVVAYLLVGLIPVTTPQTWWFIVLCGFIGITAMILPGISGSFLLLILGKYEFITNAIKRPFLPENLITIMTFLVGTTLGLLTFSRLLKYLFTRWRNETYALLFGFMIGAMKKIWPWKEVLSSKIIRGKTYILEEANIFPSSYDAEFFLAMGLMLFGLISVLLLDHTRQRRPS